MAKFILDIEDGRTSCGNCPFALEGCIELPCGGDEDIYKVLDCSKYDLTTIKLTKVEG